MAKQGGKKNRKIGKSKRKPCMARYNGEMRWARNKARRMRAHESRMLRKALRRERWLSKRKSKVSTAS